MHNPGYIKLDAQSVVDFCDLWLKADNLRLTAWRVINCQKPAGKKWYGKTIYAPFDKDNSSMDAYYPEAKQRKIVQAIKLAATDVMPLGDGMITLSIEQWSMMHGS